MAILLRSARSRIKDLTCWDDSSFSQFPLRPLFSPVRLRRSAVPTTSAKRLKSKTKIISFACIYLKKTWNVSWFHYLLLVRPHLEELNELLGVVVLHWWYVQIPKIIRLSLKSLLLQFFTVFLKNINGVLWLFGQYFCQKLD